MITFPISSSLCKKSYLQCYRLGFTIFHLSGAATGGVLLEKAFLEILQNSQETSFLIKLQAEAPASDFSRVFF